MRGSRGIRRENVEVWLAPRPCATHAYQGVDGNVLYGHVKAAAEFEDFWPNPCLVKKSSCTQGHSSRCSLAKMCCATQRASSKRNQRPDAQTPSHGCLNMRTHSNLLADLWKLKKKVTASVRSARSSKGKTQRADCGTLSWHARVPRG